MRVLVTGGAGFIGSVLAMRLAKRGDHVVIADDFSCAHWTNLTGFPGDCLTADVADEAGRQLLSRAGPFEVIFHQASITDTTVTDQRRMMRNNLEGFRAILDLAAQWNCRLIWASSASIYGRGASPMKESQAPDPLNVYAYSKLAMERLAHHYAAKVRGPLIGLRYFNVYGPHEDHKGKFASMIHQLAKQMWAGRRPRVFTAGEQRRDFVYVDDVVEANLLAAESGAAGIFNAASGQGQTFNRVVAELNRALKTALQPEYFDNPYGFTQDCTEADLTAAAKALGYRPKYDLALGIDAYLASGLLGNSLT